MEEFQCIRKHLHENTFYHFNPGVERTLAQVFLTCFLLPPKWWCQEATGPLCLLKWVALVCILHLWKYRKTGQLLQISEITGFSGRMAMDCLLHWGNSGYMKPNKGRLQKTADEGNNIKILSAARHRLSWCGVKTQEQKGQWRKMYYRSSIWQHAPHVQLSGFCLDHQEARTTKTKQEVKGAILVAVSWVEQEKRQL